MPSLLGRLVSIGYGKESTRGTAVSAAYWDKQAELNVDDKFEYAIDDAAFGQVEDAQNGDLVKKWSEGEFTTRVKQTSSSLLAAALFGTDTPAAQASPNTSVYDHVLTLLQSNQHPALTFSTNDGIQDYRYALGMIDTLEFMGEHGKYNDLKCKFFAKAGATATNSVSFPSNDTLFLPQHLTFKHASAVSGLGAASEIKIKKYSVKISQNPEIDWVLGSSEPNDIVNKSFSISGELELWFQNETDFKQYAVAGTSRAMLFDMQDTGTTIGTSANPRVQLELAKVKFTELSRDQKPDGIVSQKITFRALFSSGDSEMARMIWTNLVSSALV